MKKKCIICGVERQEEQLTNEMCELCDSLAKDTPYEIKNQFLGRKYYKEYLGQDPTKYEFVDPETLKKILAKDYLERLFKNYPNEEFWHGIIPSKCPYCLTYSTNKDDIKVVRRNTPEFERFITNKEQLQLVCKTCGDLSLYLGRMYNFNLPKIDIILQKVKEERVEIVEKKLVPCDCCHVAMIEKENYPTERKIENLKKTQNKFKFLCEQCQNKINEQIEHQRKIQSSSVHVESTTERNERLYRENEEREKEKCQTKY